MHMPEIRQLAAEGKLEWIQRPFELSDLDGNFLVIAATDSAEVNAAVYRGASSAAFCNSVDDIPNCDFFFGSVVSRGNLQIAISTAGESPAFAQRLRREIDEQLPDDLGPWLENLGRFAAKFSRRILAAKSASCCLHQLAQRPALRFSLLPVAPVGSRAARQTRLPVPAERSIWSEPDPGIPNCSPSRPCASSNPPIVILHDDLVPQAILELAPPAAEIINVGKRCGVKSITQEQINALMVEHARADRSCRPPQERRSAHFQSRRRRDRRAHRSKHSI